MLNSKTQKNHFTSQKTSQTGNPKVDELLNTINDARKALESWQDKRTEALIQLDSLSYDLRFLEEEKARAREQSEELKKEITNQARVYLSQVETLTDQMQMLKIEKEDLQSQLTLAQIAIENATGEVTNQKDIQKKIEAELNRKISEVRTDVESGVADQMQLLRAAISQLTLQNDSLAHAKNEAERRSITLEHELQGIRSQMLNALRVTPTAGATTATAGTSATPIVDRVIEVEPGQTVEEYLKKFGY